jgi:heme-degrading monooxygenase HmoA
MIPRHQPRRRTKMVIERAELPITPGREEEFEQAMVRGQELLSSDGGGNKVTLARGVESPSTYVLLIEWDDVDQHVKFTETPAFAEFRELAGPFFADAPSMEHFKPVS